MVVVVGAIWTGSAQGKEGDHGGFRKYVFDSLFAKVWLFPWYLQPLRFPARSRWVRGAAVSVVHVSGWSQSRGVRLKVAMAMGCWATGDSEGDGNWEDGWGVIVRVRLGWCMCSGFQAE